MKSNHKQGLMRRKQKMKSYLKRKGRTNPLTSLKRKMTMARY